jgi:hypothetical protein
LTLPPILFYTSGRINLQINNFREGADMIVINVIHPLLNDSDDKKTSQEFAGEKYIIPNLRSQLADHLTKKTRQIVARDHTSSYDNLKIAVFFPKSDNFFSLKKDLIGLVTSPFFVKIEFLDELFIGNETVRALAREIRDLLEDFFPRRFTIFCVAERLNSDQAYVLDDL